MTRVVVCRAAEQSQPLLDALTVAGFEPLLLPLIEVVPPLDDGTALRAALAELPRFDWLILTSPNAARAVAAGLQPQPGAGESSGVRTPTAAASTTLFERARLAVVGSTTERVSERLLGPVAFRPSAANARTLARELPLADGDRVLAPLAELASPDLVEGLQARGAEVDAPVAYRTVVPDLDHERIAEAASADAVLFSSGSTVDRFVSLVGRDAMPPHRIAIGPVTAAHMERAGIAVSAVAEETSHEGLVAALLRTLSP